MTEKCGDLGAIAGGRALPPTQFPYVDVSGTISIIVPSHVQIPYYHSMDTVECGLSISCGNLSGKVSAFDTVS